MKQDITQKGGEDCGERPMEGTFNFDNRIKIYNACQKQNDINAYNARVDGDRQRQLEREKYKQERKQLAEHKAAAREAERQAAKKKEEAARKAAEEDQAAANAKKYKENEISYSTGIFSSPIKYKSKVGTEFEFYINKNGDKFVGISGQQKYLWDPKKGSLHEIDVNNNISPAKSGSFYILEEKEFEPIKTKALAKIEPKGFSFSFFGNKEKQEKEEEEKIVYVGGKRKTKKSKKSNKSKKSTKKSKKSTKKTRKSRK